MIEKLLLVVGVTTLCMLSPGPDMMLVMRNTLTRDRRWGGLTALGVLTGNVFHIGYCTLGIALLLSKSPVAYNVLRVSSAQSYLIYLGVSEFARCRHDQTGVQWIGRYTFNQRLLAGLHQQCAQPKRKPVLPRRIQSLDHARHVGRADNRPLAVMVSVSAIFSVVFIQTLHMPMIRAKVGWLEGRHRPGVWCGAHLIRR